MIPSLGIISQRHIILPSFFQDIWWKLTNGIRQNVSLVKNTPRKRGVKNSISDIYHIHFSLYYKLEVLQIFSDRHSIHMKAFPVMLVHFFQRAGTGEQPLLAFSEACFLSLSLRQFFSLPFAESPGFFAPLYQNPNPKSSAKAMSMMTGCLHCSRPLSPLSLIHI